MEFRYGLWTGISALYGEDERQLGENNTRPLVFNRHVPAEVYPCKYKGSRNGSLINISALRVAMSHFYEATAITVAVRDYHMAQINKPVSEIPGIWDQYLISRASLALIAHRYRMDKRSPDERLPNNIASQYKLVTGIFVICREMTNAAYPASGRNDPIGAEDLYAYADDQRLFQSDSGMACAGSASKITEFLEFANLGRNHPARAKLPLEKPDDHLALLRTFVSDLESWYNYTLLTIELDYFTEMEILRRKIAASPHEAAKLQTVLDIYSAQNAYWLSLIGARGGLDGLSFEEGVLERQNAILALLERAPIKSVPEKVIHARLTQ